HCFEWKNLTSDIERADYFKCHGVRWTEFVCLDYFDLVWDTVIDPMHAILQG
ncbi:uncharacterized protein EV420DRAFT_1230535, partial [Desarmillaria tabescens]